MFLTYFLNYSFLLILVSICLKHHFLKKDLEIHMAARQCFPFIFLQDEEKII